MKKVKVNYDEDLWFPAANILYHGNRILNDLSITLSSNDRKMITESLSVAIMIVGINKQLEDTYRIQFVHPKEQTPDIRTSRLVETPGEPNLLDVQEVEVVTLEKNSNEQVDHFLKRTKLSDKVFYPKTTTILCHINKRVKKSKSWTGVHKSLKSCKHKSPTFVLARVDPELHKYQLVRVHPELDIFVEYDVRHELFSNPRQKVLKLQRGATPFLRPTGKDNLPFEIIDG